MADSWHELNVIDSAADKLDLCHNGKIQICIYHNIKNDNNEVPDIDGWAMGEDSDHRPELVIIYNK